ncbi:hypothetical protein BCR39DRAFT_525659 [Naematelia encephala]|uniref:Homeodomain-like protein n=1 Tax=Naematelia encephala TaxID=71784 RepID=A0A1Y2BAF9_9TREE|nr:hypothetical protein BCR39DRAFT_525659 [Naematelia encephala]
MENLFDDTGTFPVENNALPMILTESDDEEPTLSEAERKQIKAQRKAERRAKKQAREARQRAAGTADDAEEEDRQGGVQDKGTAKRLKKRKVETETEAAEVDRRSGDEEVYQEVGARRVEATKNDQLDGDTTDARSEKKRRTELVSSTGKATKKKKRPAISNEMVDFRLYSPESLTDESVGEAQPEPAIPTSSRGSKTRINTAPRPIKSLASSSDFTKPGPSRLPIPIPEMARARLSMAAPRKPRNGERKETDDELRRAFRTEGAAYAWLASKWVGLNELQRLEAEGILTYKRGKFSQAESMAVKQHLAMFQHVNRISDHELVNLVMAKGRMSERRDFPKFWPEVAATVPGRPVKYVKDHVHRMYDPRGRKGAWTKSEDEELLRAYQRFPNEWAKIGDIVDRTELDCRDRYKNELRDRGTRHTGHWTDEECRQLVKCVKEANTSLGMDPLGAEAPWDIVCEKMGGTRTRTQCRKKWQSSVRMTEINQGIQWKLAPTDRPELIKLVRNYQASSEADIVWQDIAVGPLAKLAPKAIQSAWWRMKQRIKDSHKMELNGRPFLYQSQSTGVLMAIFFGRALG